jgi:quercetin dioxygenase-like cupin family protein
MADSTAGHVPREVVHLAKEDQVMRFDVLPGGEVEGSRRGVANGIRGTSCMVNLLTILGGQRSPTRSFTAEHVVYQVAGRSNWEVGEVTYTLSEGDLLFIPANCSYAISNDDQGPGFFLDIATSAGQWPPQIAYEGGEVQNREAAKALFDEA